jgi:vitamin B12 transporter
MPALPIDTDQIVITASRVPESEAEAAASFTIIDEKRIERLDEPLIPALLRLTPSVAVSTSGPAGSFTEVRIRGAEVNHTLLFDDGIRVNDPASGDFPRFELLNADLASRIEVVRGPQSALWGSEAIGGVIAINGVADSPGARASAEAGSFGFQRAGVSGAMAGPKAGIAGALGWQRATGIDSFDGNGDKDGYRNLSGRLRASWHPVANVELGASGLALTGRTQFDGFDPLTFAHTDTLDSSGNRLLGGRAWARLGSSDSPWSGQLAAALLRSSNRNYLDEEQINRTRGARRTLSAQLERRFAIGLVNNTFVLAADSERETFHARDTIYGGFSNQDRSRSHRALTFEWRGAAKGVNADLALRRDMFNRFKDATTFRTSLLVPVGGGFALAGSYGEGIAQPTFFDLYGFFPNNFLGNPDIKPENSRGFELSLRYRRGPVEASLTGYRQKLHSEIVDVFDFASGLFSTANRHATSRRAGIEASLAWNVSDKLRLAANYAFLDATQPDDSALTEVHELRRPRHSASIVVDGVLGRKLTYGGSIAYVGRHSDQRDTFPFDRVGLGSYWLVDGRLAYAVTPGVELFARGSNLLDQRYQDVFGYRTEGRGLFVGIRLADRRSSP